MSENRFRPLTSPWDTDDRLTRPNRMSSSLTLGNGSFTLSFMSLSKVGQLKVLRPIGNGGMGRVFLCLLCEKGEERKVAVKTLFDGTISKREYASFMNEIDVLNKIDHENIVKTFGVTEIFGECGIVMEYLAYGSYATYFTNFWKHVKKTEETQKLMIPFKIRLLNEVINAMDYLHRSFRATRVLHLDLKWENVLLTDRMQAKICDFGLSILSTRTELRSRGTSASYILGGTPSYIAPELLRTGNITPTSKCDVYSFGILEFSVLADSNPYPDNYMKNLEKLFDLVARYDFRPNTKRLSDIYPKELISMMQECWQREPNARPKFRSLKDKMLNLKAKFEDFDEKAQESIEKIKQMLQSASVDESSQCSCESEFNEKNSSFSSIKRCQSHPPADVVVPAPPSPVKRKRVILATTMIAIVIGAIITATAVMLSQESSGRNEDGNQDNAIVDEEDRVCRSPKPPIHGRIACEKEAGSFHFKCQIYCDEGYILKRNDTIFCSEGKWSDAVPSCSAEAHGQKPAEIICLPLNEVEYTDINCDNGYSVGSTCNFTCRNPQKTLQGSSEMTCTDYGIWSDNETQCVCRDKCSLGDDCSLSSKLSHVERELNGITTLESKTVVYAGHSIRCRVLPVDLSQSSLKFVWRGTCTDIASGNAGICHPYTSKHEAARRAVSELIRTMVSTSLYPAPCDQTSFPGKC